MATAAIGDQLFAVVLSWVAVGLFGTAAGYLTATMAGATLVTALLLEGASRPTVRSGAAADDDHRRPHARRRAAGGGGGLDAAASRRRGHACLM